MASNAHPRVLHVLARLDPEQGGPPRSVLGLARAEARAGAEVCLLAGGDAAPPPDGAGPAVRVAGGPHLSPRYAVPGRRLLAALRREVAAADVVHVHGVWNGTVTAAEAACRRRGKPYVVSPRGMLDAVNVRHRRLLKGAYYRVLERANLGAAAGWHFLDETERRGAAWTGFPRHRSSALVVPNGLDAGRIAAEAQKRFDPGPDWSDGGVNLVFLGRLHRIKGLEMQVQALRLLDRRGVRCRLHLVGPDDGEGARLAALARDLGIADRVHATGPVYGDARFRLLRAADAVLLTSRYECNSNAAAETLAAGGLLVATETCNLETARDAGAAVVVPRAADAVAAAVAETALAPATAAGYRERGARFARERLAWPRIAGEMLAFYRRVVDGP